MDHLLEKLQVGKKFGPILKYTPNRSLDEIKPTLAVSHLSLKGESSEIIKLDGFRKWIAESTFLWTTITSKQSSLYPFVLLMPFSVVEPQCHRIHFYYFFSYKIF